MKPVMYLFLRQDLGMSTGKAAAQVAHAAVEAYRITPFEMIEEWLKGGHYTKIVLTARDGDHVRDIQIYLRERGFSTRLIIDEGRTEIASHTPTALGVEVVDKDDEHTAATFSSFKTYRDPEPIQVQHGGKGSVNIQVGRSLRVFRK